MCTNFVALVSSKIFRVILFPTRLLSGTWPVEVRNAENEAVILCILMRTMPSLDYVVRLCPPTMATSHLRMFLLMYRYAVFRLAFSFFCFQDALIRSPL